MRLSSVGITQSTKYILVVYKSGRANRKGNMGAVNTFFNWLFATRTGVVVLVLGGIVVFVLIAVLMEISTRKHYTNHEKSEDDWDLFDDDNE